MQYSAVKMVSTIFFFFANLDSKYIDNVCSIICVLVRFRLIII